MVRNVCGRILFVFASMCVVGKNPNTPTWRTMADDTITWDSIGVLGSPFYICGCSTSKGDFVAVSVKVMDGNQQTRNIFCNFGMIFYEKKWNEMTLPILEKHSRGGMQLKSQTHAPIPLPNLFCITSDFKQGQSH